MLSAACAEQTAIQKTPAVTPPASPPVETPAPAPAAIPEAEAKAPIPEPEAPPVIPPPSLPTFTETGVAGWYGKEMQGRKTASGEIFDVYAFTAAHRTLPLGTFITVTDLDTAKTVTVRVNDRGPFINGRILELSYGAARELGFAAKGTARVKIEATDPDHDRPLYTIQAAVFTEEENARVLKERLSGRYELISIMPFETNLGKFYRVRVGSYHTEEKAEAVARKLKLEGLEPIVVRKD